MPEYRSADRQNVFNYDYTGKAISEQSRTATRQSHAKFSATSAMQKIFTTPFLPYTSAMKKSRLRKKLKTWLDQPEVPWFSPDTQIINETEILQQKDIPPSGSKSFPEKKFL